jgi:hypothetical protein
MTDSHDKPRIADAATTPRNPRTGNLTRERPTYSQGAGSREDFTQWEVTVTPLRGMTTKGRGFDSGRHRPQVTFEVRGAWYGPGLPEFGSQPNTRMAPVTYTEDSELAMAIARAIESVLRAGKRDLDFFAIARDVETGRA